MAYKWIKTYNSEPLQPKFEQRTTIIINKSCWMETIEMNEIFWFIKRKCLMTDACCLNLKSTPEITIQVNFNSKHCELSEMRNFNLGAEYQISFLRFVFFHVCCFAGCACRLLTLSVHFTGLAPHAFGISVKGGTSTKIR